MEVFNEEVIFIAADLSLDEVAVDFDEEDLYFFERCIVHPQIKPSEIKISSLLELRRVHKGIVEPEDEATRRELEKQELLDKEKKVTDFAKKTTYALGANLKTYERCIFANRVTVGGLVLRHIGSGLERITSKAKLPGRIVGAIGDVLVLHSGEAQSTYEAYRRVILQIQQEGTLDPTFARELSKTYCRRRGVELAAQEAGIDLSKAPYKV